MMEYKIEVIPAGPLFSLETRLNELGSAGWSLVDIIKDVNGYQCTFSRPKKND